MAKKKDEMLELAKKQSDALLEADMAALDEQTQRETADALALDALAQTHAAESAAQSAYNQAQYANVGQILNDIQGKIDTAKQKDETALKREKAFRYISGLGDTLSGVANLVGTAHGASNQNQTYNSHAVVQKAEEARKARKLEMDDLSKRLDEMQTRQRDLKAAGSLAEAQLKAKQDRERLELEASQRKAADEAKRDADNKAYRAMRDARQDWQDDRKFAAQQDQWNRTYNMQYTKFQEEQGESKYNFTFSDGSIDVPKDKLNDVNIERIYQMLPEEIRNTIKGEAYTEYETDEYGTQVRKTGYKAPSLNQKLAAIGAYAESDKKIKDELLRLAGKNPKKETPSTENKPKSGKDWSSRRDSTLAPATPDSAKAGYVANAVEGDTLRAMEEDIMNNDSVYINGKKYAKL